MFKSDMLFKSCLERQVNKGVRIASSKGEHVLNSRSQFYQAPLVRQVVAHGLAGEQGEVLVVEMRGEEQVEAEEEVSGAEEGGEGCQCERESGKSNISRISMYFVCNV